MIQLNANRPKLEQLPTTQRVALEPILFAVLQQTSAHTGLQYFEQLLPLLCQQLDMQYASISCYQPVNASLITLRHYQGPSPIPNQQHTFATAPCATMPLNQFSYYAEQVAAQFPQDQLMQQLQIKSYIALPIGDADAQLQGVLAIYHPQSVQLTDIQQYLLQFIAARCQAELQRTLDQDALALAQDVLQNLYDGLMITDANQVIQAVNPAFTEITGYSSAEAIGQTPSLLSSGLHGADFYLEMRQSLQQHGYWKNRIIDRNKNGQLIHGWLTIKALTHHHAATTAQYIGIFEDITQKVLQEQENENLSAQLLQSQKMEAIAQLTDGIAHDFNNILACIQGYTELANRLNQNLTESKLTIYLDEIMKASLRAQRLIKQLLLYSRQQSGEPHVFNATSQIKNCMQMLQGTFPSSIIMQLHQPIECYINCDPIQFDQIILNLCINARDAMANKGKLDITLQQHDNYTGRCSACHQRFNGAYLEVCISDTGNGISPDNLSHIFEPFFTTKPKGQGSGMGLSTVRGILHNYQAHIIVESQPTQGSKFRLFFPKADRQPTLEQIVTEHNPPHATSHSTTSTILLVEDEPIVGEMLQELLEMNDYRVHYFADSVAALDWFKQQSARVDLVLTDHTMPHLSGFDMADMIRQLSPSLPIIMLSGSQEMKHQAQQPNSAISAFFEKPFQHLELLTEIQRLLQP